MNFDDIREYLQNGGDVNVSNFDGNTILMIRCIECDDINDIKLLLEYGADVNLYNKKYYTALYLLEVLKEQIIFNRTNFDIRETFNKIIKLLLQYNAYTNYDWYDSTCIILSNMSNSTQDDIKQLKRLTKFDYNSILLFELKKCVF